MALELFNNTVEIDNNGILSSSGQTFVMAARNTAQSMAHNSWTTIVYDIEDTDTRSEYDTGTGIFTASGAGIYLVNWAALITSTALTAGDWFLAAVSKNDSVAAGGIWYGHRYEAEGGQNDYPSSVGTVIIDLAASDTLRVKGNLNIDGNPHNLHNDRGNNYFVVVQVG